MLVHNKHVSHSDCAMAVAIPNHACLMNTAINNQDDRLQKH